MAALYQDCTGKKKKKAKLKKSKLKATSSICETNDVLFSM